MARRIEVTAASAVALGAVCLLLAALEIAIPVVLRNLADAGVVEDPSFRAVRDAFVSGAGSSAIWNGAFGVALVAIGFGVGRRARWSHPAMTFAAWGSIVALAAIAKPSLAPVVALSGESRAASAILWIVATVLLAIQVGAVLWFLRFWRSEAVRSLFR